MWNIRSHARRFPVHTGTLTPSIAHPNRFLNHLKRFSAGFLTFRGGKAEMQTLWGENSPSLLRRQPPLGWGPWHRGKSLRVNRKASRIGRDGNPLSHGLRRARFPLLSPAVTSSPGAGEVFPLRGSFIRADWKMPKSSPFGGAVCDHREQTERVGSLSEGAGKPAGFD